MERSKRERSAVAAWHRMVRADLQRRENRVAVRHGRQCVFVPDDYASGTRADVDCDGQQRRPRKAVFAGKRRRDAVAVRAFVLELVRPVMRSSCLAVALWLLAPAPAAAEWQVRPFIGFTFGGATTFVDPEKAIGTNNAVIGVAGGWLGEILGVEADFGRAPGFFQVQDPPIPDAALLTSAVTTMTGNVVIALPARLAGYGLRPYFSGGAGMMHI